MSNDHNRERAERKANKPRRDPNEAKKRAVESHIARMAQNAGAEVPFEEKPSVPSVQSTPASSPVQDQNNTEQAPSTEPKKKKKVSQTVINWRAKENLPLEGRITISPEAKAKNPKSRGAADRFALYEDGMSVQQYIDKSTAAGNGKALAAADVRWDVVKGFITVE